jgi:hypothetical protein
LIEIFKNEILVKLVTVQDLYADNINDILDDKSNVYTNEVDLKHWKNIIQDQVIDDKDMHNKYVKLFNKTLAIDITPEGEWMQLIDEPKLFIKKLKKSVLFEDDLGIQFFEMFIKRFVPLHIGTESYVPKLITPLCYLLDFKFKLEAEKV